MDQELQPFKKVLILGSQGQLGRAFQEYVGRDRTIQHPDPQVQVISATRQEADFSRTKSCLEYIEKIRPHIILNAAAYTQVDQAEKEPDLAFQINAETPTQIAQWCAKNAVPFVHFSTDYVFSGEGLTPWEVTSPIHPLNVYGKSKAEGEKGILIAGGNHLIFRTSWVYDRHGKNFLTTMLRLGQERETLKVVDDQIGAPTWTADLAAGAWACLQSALRKKIFPSGIYHLCNEGETSWFRFAHAIFEIAKNQGASLKIRDLLPLSSNEYPTPAKRPKNSRLSTLQTQNTFGVRLPDWHESLKLCLQQGTL